MYRNSIVFFYQINGHVLLIYYYTVGLENDSMYVSEFIILCSSSNFP